MPRKIHFFVLASTKHFAVKPKEVLWFLPLICTRQAASGPPVAAAVNSDRSEDAHALVRKAVPGGVMPLLAGERLGCHFRLGRVPLQYHAVDLQQTALSSSAMTKEHQCSFISLLSRDHQAGDECKLYPVLNG
jgi:hypothetical protein